MSKIIDKQKELYKIQFDKFGDSPDGTYNQNSEIQNLRFERLIKHIPVENVTSIHDVGCGICDLFPFLKTQSFKGMYSGTEIVPEMVELAAKKYPEIKLFLRDIITEKVIDSYDFSVLSGTFNLPGSITHEEWKQFSRKLIKSMFEISNSGIAFNFLTSYVDFRNPLMYYESPLEVFDFCSKELSRFVVIDQSYPLYEFTTTVYKEEFISKQYNNPAFGKYFKNK